MLKIVRAVSDLKTLIIAERSQGNSIGFVPTMGALHQGHASLICRSSEENDLTVVSIFVNPTQFNNSEDLKLYPRSEAEDIALACESGANVIFAPTIAEMYPNSGSEVATPVFSALEVLEGAFRPGHFQGVMRIVRKLLLACQPDRSYFGEKDLQQLVIIRLLAKAEDLPGSIVNCLTLREPTGLAMSSRNERLTPNGRLKAAKLYEALSGLRHLATLSFLTDGAVKEATEALEMEGFQVDYLAVVDPVDFRVMEPFGARVGMHLAVAAQIEGVRLIDNVCI